MIIYISGAITNDPDYRDKFAVAEMTIKYFGHTPLNPCCLPDGLTWEQYMKIDLAMIDVADAICLLPDWQQSRGAIREFTHAVAKDKQVIFYEDFVREGLEKRKKK